MIIVLDKILITSFAFSIRYAYSDDGGEDFVNEANKSLIKTEPYPYKDSWSFSVSSDNKETTTPEDDEDGEEKRE